MEQEREVVVTLAMDFILRFPRASVMDFHRFLYPPKVVGTDDEGKDIMEDQTMKVPLLSTYRKWVAGYEELAKEFPPNPDVVRFKIEQLIDIGTTGEKPINAALVGHFAKTIVDVDPSKQFNPAAIFVAPPSGEAIAEVHQILEEGKN